ncbi:MAG: hypothetical protein ACLGH6_06770 [Gammaproteobacteria bacterium]
MKHATLAATTIAFALLTGTATAAEHRGPDMTQWQERMQRMDRMLDQARKSDDPQQHQKLMQEHMQSMQEGMGMMRGMRGDGMGMSGDGKGGPMASGKDAGKSMGSMDANQRMDMMQQRMDMMQMMMEHMMGQQAEQMRMGPGMGQGMGNR